MNHISLILSVVALALVPLAACSDRASEQGAGDSDTASTQGTGAGDSVSAERNVDEKLGDVEAHLRLEARLAANAELNALQIDTDVRDGTAYLSGELHSSDARELAAQEAAAVDGIHSVRNDIRIVSDDEKSSVAEKLASRADDARITATVKSRLLASENTTGLDIGVDTNDQVVTLSGTVDSDTERDLAGLIAENTSGVRKVENLIKLGSD